QHTALGRECTVSIRVTTVTQHAFAATVCRKGWPCMICGFVLFALGRGLSAPMKATTAVRLALVAIAAALLAYNHFKSGSGGAETHAQADPIPANAREFALGTLVFKA